MANNDWQRVPLGELATEITVGHVGTMANEYIERGIPFLRSLNILPYRVTLDDVKFIRPEFHDRLKKSSLKPGDVVIVRTGKPGTCAVVPNFLPVSNCSDLVMVRPGSRLNPRFLAYYVNGVAVHHVSAHLVGAVQQHFNVESARKMIVVLPHRKKQDRIAKILGTLDDKIELNRRMNETLEAMARRLFKSWFVDFDPVHAKAALRREYPKLSNADLSRRALPNLDPQIAELFPDGFEDSTLGPIPKGSKVGSILETAELLSGGTPKTSEPSYWDGDIKWASAKDVSQCGEPFLLNTERLISKAGLENSSTRMIDPFSTVVVARGATTGRLTMFGDSIAMNQTCYALRTKVAAPLHLYLHVGEIMDELVQTAHGSVFDTITTRTFESGVVLIAAPNVAVAFHRCVEPLFLEVLDNQRQTQTLQIARDKLLPRLLSGELNV